jgi:hypothetical protein
MFFPQNEIAGHKAMGTYLELEISDFRLSGIQLSHSASKYQNIPPMTTNSRVSSAWR